MTSAAVKFKARLSPRLKSSRLALGCRRQAHAFNFNQLNRPSSCRTSKKRNKQCGGENGLCADPLAKSRFYRRALLSYFLFPSASVFFFFGRPLWHGSSHKSTAEKLPRKTFICLICNSPLAELFFIYSALFKAYVCTNFSFPR